MKNSGALGVEEILVEISLPQESFPRLQGWVRSPSFLFRNSSSFNTCIPYLSVYHLFPALNVSSKMVEMWLSQSLLYSRP